MRKILIILSVLQILLLYSCEDYTPSQYKIDSDSTEMIQSEYKYGDDGGVFSISDALLSADSKTIGFHGISGYKNTINTIIGEIGIDGHLLWQHTVDQITDSLMLFVKTYGGFLAYESKEVQTNEIYPLYFVSSSMQTTFQVALPKINKKFIQRIYYIEYLDDENCLIYVFANNQYYFATFTIENNAFVLTSDWISYNTGLDIASAQMTSNGVEIVGISRKPSPWICKIRLINNSTGLIWTNQTVINDWIFRETAKQTDIRSAIHNNLIYFYLINDETYRLVCLDINNGGFKGDSQSWPNPYHSFDFVYCNNKMYTLRYYLKVNSYIEEVRGYSCFRLYDMDGRSIMDCSLGYKNCQSEIKAAFVYENQLFLFGYTGKKYTDDYKLVDWLIQYNGCKGWFFKINLSDLQL